MDAPIVGVSYHFRLTMMVIVGVVALNLIRVTKVNIQMYTAGVRRE